MSIEIRKVAGVDLAISGLFAKLQSEGQILPNPFLSTAWIGEKDGRIVSHAIVHSLPIVEYVHAESGAGDSIRELFKQAKNFLLESGAPRVLCHTEHRAMKRMLARVSFNQSPFIWHEWRK